MVFIRLLRSEGRDLLSACRYLRFFNHLLVIRGHWNVGTYLVSSCKYLHLVANLWYQATRPVFFVLQDFFVDHETFLNDLENIVEKILLVSCLNGVQIFLVLLDTLNLLVQKLVDRLETLLQL